MAAATTLIAAGGLALSAGKTIGEGIAKGKTRKRIENYEMPTLSNAFKGLRLSTEGADYATREQQAQNAALLDFFQSLGTRGLGGVGLIQANNNALYGKIKADLDSQEARREQLIAQDDLRIQQMEENRAFQDLQGLGAQYNAANQGMWQGLNNMVYFGSQLGSMLPSGNRQDTSRIDAMSHGYYVQGGSPAMYDFGGHDFQEAYRD